MWMLHLISTCLNQSEYLKFLEKIINGLIDLFPGNMICQTTRDTLWFCELLLSNRHVKRVACEPCIMKIKLYGMQFSLKHYL